MIIRRLLAAALALAAAACGSSPAAPTTTTSTTTTTTTPTAPAAPVTLALTGTWMLGTTPAFFITQTGTTITGTQIFTPVVSAGVIVTESGTVSGTMTSTTEGATVTLSLPTTMITVGTGALAGTSITCRSTDKWVGQATNSKLTGTYTAGTFACDGAGGVIDTKVSGTQIYTKQGS
ncbi:MAG: hypothetical protein WCQ64_02615 [Acidobacteriota bacterium]